MKYKGCILIDDPRAEKLGIGYETFRDFFAWDCRPRYIGIIRLRPKNKEALEYFMICGQKIYLEIRICAPDADTIELSKKYHYELKTDPAGTPYLTDEQYKLSKRK